MADHGFPVDPCGNFDGGYRRETVRRVRDVELHPQILQTWKKDYKLRTFPSWPNFFLSIANVTLLPTMFLTVSPFEDLRDMHVLFKYVIVVIHDVFYNQLYVCF